MVKFKILVIHIFQVAMFHCLEQTEGEGGANLWVDAFHAAHLLYQEHPESFQVLVKAPVVFHNFTKTSVGQMYNRSRHPLIRLVILLPILVQDYWQRGIYFC